MMPFSDAGRLTREESLFNYRLLRAKMVIKVDEMSPRPVRDKRIEQVDVGSDFDEVVLNFDV